MKTCAVAGLALADSSALTMMHGTCSVGGPRDAMPSRPLADRRDQFLEPD
jgi:hypothetical protein